MTTQLEIESKFDAEPGQALPDLVGVGGVVATAASAEMVLTAGYFDTESLALGSAGPRCAGVQEEPTTGGTSSCQWRTASGWRCTARSVAAGRRRPRSHRWSRP